MVWNKPESQYAVPLWIIILAILAGLLLLALLIYVLYKVSGRRGDFVVLCGMHAGRHGVFNNDAPVVMFSKWVQIKAYLIGMDVASQSWERTALILILTFLVSDTMGV